MVGLSPKSYRFKISLTAKTDLICWISAYKFRAVFSLNCIGLINLNTACFQLCFSQNSHMAVHVAVGKVLD